VGISIQAGLQLVSAGRDAFGIAKRVVSALSGPSNPQASRPDQQTFLDVQGGPPTLFFAPGAKDIDIVGQGFPPGTKLEVDPITGEVKVVKRRRRRKRLLTCQDKADIAFLRGQLGGGEMGRTAISSLLSRCG